MIHSLAGEGITDQSDNRLAFAFWVCLELERYVCLLSVTVFRAPTANERLDHSGLFFQKSETPGLEWKMMPYPNIQLAEGDFDEHVLKGFSVQAYLRKRWYEISELYGNKDEPLCQSYLGHAEKTLTELIGLGLGITPSEAPAKDVLSAKLRARYWGVWVITYRPFVRQVLELNSSNRGQEIAPEARDRALHGVTAIIESTRAFHGLDVTFVNPFETAAE